MISSIPLAIILGVSVATLLIISGYLLGTKRGLRAREQLREQSLQQADEKRLLAKKLAQVKLKDNNKILDYLRLTVEQALKPLTQREQLSFELSNLSTDSNDRTNLVLLLDEIADKGQFWAVSLHDEQGLPVAASSNSKNLDRLTAISAMVLLFAERIGRDDEPAPLSLMMHDELNMATLCRIFHVGQHKLLLSAVATGTRLTPTSLDPALAKVDNVLLSTKHYQS